MTHLQIRKAVVSNLASPKLEPTAALLATVVAVTEVGDNATIVFEINDGETHPDFPPLVYVDRRYHRVGDIVTN